MRKRKRGRKPGSFFRILQTVLRLKLLAREGNFQHGIHVLRIAL